MLVARILASAWFCLRESLNGIEAVGGPIPSLLLPALGNVSQARQFEINTTSC
jgi:hypothetical protein